MMPNRLSSFVFVGVMLLGTAAPALAGDGSVRFLTVGPVLLGDGHTAHMRVLLPAVRPSAQVQFLGEGGVLLKAVEVEPPGRGVGPLFEVIFDAKFVDDTVVRAAGRGTLSITDGTSNTIVYEGPSSGIIAILIGLRQARGMGTLQVVDRAGQSVFILPYIEQDNLFER